MNDEDSTAIENLWLPPGSLVYIGGKQDKKVNISLIEYDYQTYSESHLEDIEEYHKYKDNSMIKWVNITGIHNVKTIEKVGSFFNINSLTLEDILDTNHLTKIEICDDYIFIIIKAHMFEENNDNLKTEQISLLFNQNYLITFTETDINYINIVKDRIKNGKGHIRKYRTDYLAYSIIDSILDKQFETIKIFDNLVEELEEQVVMNVSQTILRCIHDYKKDAVRFRQSFWALRDMVNILQKLDEPLMNQYMTIYLRDLYDHSSQLIESLEMIRETISHMFDIYLTGVSNRMNEIIKVLAIISTLFMPLTFLAGIYGMNFKHFPGMEEEYSFYLLLFIMGCIVLTMLLFFKKKKWI